MASGKKQINVSKQEFDDLAERTAILEAKFPGGASAISSITVGWNTAANKARLQVVVGTQTYLFTAD